ncbi:putative mediator of RNA polymerase II transcription subunit 26 [Harpegnathos saltator]|uniref:putative mediator of RNA polymerase II transcription subunit 26 n=1 Tax=Harpegnathos saltator TaxID=610380 RepID=UPI00058E8948|nr:putative mediator of RNA polymerase II transcription subunit 26 [Harpegnathos saltator]
MRLPILLVAVMSAAWAETRNAERPVRAPQGQVKYGDIDGSRIDWKYVAPQQQWRPHLANAQRPQRAEGGSPHRPRQAQRGQQHAAAPAQQSQPQQLLQPVPQSIQNQQFYRPYSAVPSHIKQLIEQNYQPQPPYVDPTSFFYSSTYVAPQQHEQQQPAPAASELPRAAYLQPSARYQSIDQRRAQPRFDYSVDKRVERQDQVVYKDNYEQQQHQLAQQQQQQLAQQQQQQQQHPLALSANTVPEPPLPTIYLDRNMPSELKQLLQFQAQIPYDVTANRIQYTPKSIFIPKPLSDDVKGPYYYRSKVYYMDEVDAEEEQQQSKPADEEQRH